MRVVVVVYIFALVKIEWDLEGETLDLNLGLVFQAIHLTSL